MNDTEYDHHRKERAATLLSDLNDGIGWGAYSVGVMGILQRWKWEMKMLGQDTEWETR